MGYITFMYLKWCFLSLIGMIAVASSVSAQIAATFQLPRRMYVAGESLVGVVRITNHAGRTLVFQSDGRAQWLNFMVKDSSGNTVNPLPAKMFGPMQIEAGKTLAREVDLSKLFQLTEPGNYSVVASIRIPQEKQVLANTNKVLFSQSNGTIQWKQGVGLGQGGGATREYRLIQFTDENKSYLYAQLLDGTGTRKLSTFRLGEALTLRRPMVTVDRSQRMHVLYLGTPSMYVHCAVDSAGRLATSQIHQRGPVGDPYLATNGDGTVQVVNSIPYDPKQVQQREGKVRKATDRPSITY